MAHRSKKKHLRHVHQHEPETAAPRAKKHAGAKAEIEVERVAGPRAKAGARRGGARATKPAAKPVKKRGIVRRLANAAAKRIVAKPKRVIRRLLGK